MRHAFGHRKLNMPSARRRALLRGLAVSLITHERVRTTLPRAKELRRFVEPLITLGKSPSVANRRLAFNRLRNRGAVVKIFNELGAHFKERPGGYLRVLRHGFRNGDNAPMAYVELVDRAAAAESESTPAPAAETDAAPSASAVS